MPLLTNPLIPHCSGLSTHLLFIDDIHPNKHLHTDLGQPVGSNKPKPITFVKSHHNLGKSVSKPMAEYNPDDLIGRTFLSPPNHKGERHRASIKQNDIEVSHKLDADQETMAENINFLLDVGEGGSQAIISYNQVLNCLEKDNQDEETLLKFRASHLLKFRAITGHQGPLDINRILSTAQILLVL